VALPKFITWYANVDMVDLLTIDNEGAEFEILPLLASSTLNVTICQFNVEMHTGMALSNQLRQQLIDMFEKGDFVLLHHERHSIGFLRLFFVNIGDRLCVERYIGSPCSKR